MYWIYLAPKTSEGMKIPQGYQLAVSDSGEDKGYVLRYKYGRLNLKANKFESTEEVLYFSRIVATEWTVESSGRKSKVVPNRIRRDYFDSPPKKGRENTGSRVQRIKFNWKSFAEPSEDELTLKSIVSITASMKSEIDRALNR